MPALLSMWPRFYSWDKYGIVLVWPALFRLLEKIGGTGKQPRGAAFGPIMLLRHEDQAAPWLFNHERIHVVQTMELGIIGFWVLYYGQLAYARWWLKKSKWEAYLWNSAEQEAYLNQHNLEYLKTRPLWAQFRYLKNRRKFHLTDKAGELIFDD